MVVEVIVLVVILAYCFLQKDERSIVSLFLILLPFHTFFKSSFHYFLEGGELFSAWKEAAILILAYRVFGNTHLRINRLVFVLAVAFSILIAGYFFAAKAYVDALPALRDHLFPALLFFAIAGMKQDQRLIRKFIFILAVSVFISDLAGFAQYFFFKVPVARIMDTAAWIDPSGYIHYRISSYRIMGIERMSGITGSPNIFGLFNAFAVILFFGILLFRASFPFNRKQMQFIQLVLFVSVISLLLSFSRAGWAIALFGSGILLLYRNFHVRIKYMLSSALLLVALAMVMSVFYPQGFSVISGSLSGEEASAAARSSSVMKGIRMLLDEPWGHGLGTTDNRKETVSFFVESAWMNIGYEIGIAGVIYLICMHFVILYFLIKHAQNDALARIAVAISSATLMAGLVSVNPYGMPYIYLWWFMLALGMKRAINAAAYTRDDVYCQVPYVDVL